MMNFLHQQIGDGEGFKKPPPYYVDIVKLGSNLDMHTQTIDTLDLTMDRNPTDTKLLVE